MNLFSDICQLGKQIPCIILTRTNVYRYSCTTEHINLVWYLNSYHLDSQLKRKCHFNFHACDRHAWSRFSMSHFSSRWYLCAWKSPYALHPVSQKFPQCWLWNGSNVHLMATSKLAWSSKQWMWQLNSRSTRPYMPPSNNDCLAPMFVTASGWDPMPRNVEHLVLVSTAPWTHAMQMDQFLNTLKLLLPNRNGLKRTEETEP